MNRITGSTYEFLRIKGSCPFDLPFKKLGTGHLRAMFCVAKDREEVCLEVTEEEGNFLWLYPQDEISDLDQRGIQYRVITKKEAGF